jgi:hypothetical protein
MIRDSTEALGFTRVQDPSPEFQARIEALYRSPSRRRFKFRNVYKRSFPDGELYLFDLSETSGDDSTILAHMGLAVVSDQLALPWFSMQPKLKLGQKLSALATRLVDAGLSGHGQRIDFSNQPAFDDRYWVFSSEQDAVLAFLDNRLLRAFVASPGYNLVAGGDTFVCNLPEYKYLKQQPGDLELLKSKINVGLQLYNYLKAASGNYASETKHFEASRLPSHCPACGGDWAESGEEGSNFVCQYCGHTLSISTPEPWKAAPSTKSHTPTNVKTPEFIQKMSTGSRILQSGCLLIFGIVWVLISTFVIVLIAVDFYQNYKVTQLLINEGVGTRAMITKLTVDYDSEDGNTYYVSYQYQIPIKGDFAPYSGRQTVSSDLYAILEKGGKVDILYAASQPSISDIEANVERNPYAQIFRFFCFIGLGVLLLLVGLVVTIGGLVGYWGKNKDEV